MLTSKEEEADTCAALGQAIQKMERQLKNTTVNCMITASKNKRRNRYSNPYTVLRPVCIRT